MVSQWIERDKVIQGNNLRTEKVLRKERAGPQLRVAWNDVKIGHWQAETKSSNKEHWNWKLPSTWVQRKSRSRLQLPYVAGLLSPTGVNSSTKCHLLGSKVYSPKEFCLRKWSKNVLIFNVKPNWIVIGINVQWHAWINTHIHKITAVIKSVF